MTQTERIDASISSTPSSGSPLAYPSLAAFEAHLGALGAKPAHLRRICRAWLGSASAAWPDALGAEAEQPARSRAARRLRPETKKVVFMGMGEPSHNLDNVLRAVEFLALYGGFGHKDLVISTVGDERLFEALNQMSARPALAVSLHTTDDAKRRTLLPRGAKMTVKALTEAAEAWARKTGYPTQYQWTLIQGVNDGEEEVDRLIALLTGHYAMVNFIPVNAVEGSVYSRPDREHAAHLVRRLKSAGIVATLRDSAAQDVDGGCGQLRARVLSAESKARAEQAVRRTATPFDRNSNA